MVFFASLLVSCIGFVAFSYGKGMHRFAFMLLGMAMMVYPYFVDSLWLMLAIAGALLGLLWLAAQRDW
jgi:hypothetical protein